jgi:Holliday junction resolvase RusA-like endonuclease
VPVLEKFLISSSPITIWLAGKPTPQGRARFSRRSGHAYDPQRSRTWKNAAEVIFRKYMEAHALDPLTGALELHYEAIFAVPKSYSIKKREAALSGLAPFTKSPDLDNLVKIIQDAMNGIIFIDDRQITDLISSKRYGPEDGVRVTVVECPILT